MINAMLWTGYWLLALIVSVGLAYMIGAFAGFECANNGGRCYPAYLISIVLFAMTVVGTKWYLARHPVD